MLNTFILSGTVIPAAVFVQIELRLYQRTILEKLNYGTTKRLNLKLGLNKFGETPLFIF